MQHVYFGVVFGSYLFCNIFIYLEAAAHMVKVQEKEESHGAAEQKWEKKEL